MNECADSGQNNTKLEEEEEKLWLVRMAEAETNQWPSARWNWYEMTVLLENDHLLDR